MQVDIWSDVICPWCYVGKRRMEAAIRQFRHGDEIEVRWHSFELDPGAPAAHLGDYPSRMSRKYGITPEQARASADHLKQVGASDGLEFDFDGVRSGNTFDAHRLIHLAAESGIQDAVKERLMRAYFSEGELVSDHEALTRVTTEVGLDADEVRSVLSSDAYADAVRHDEAAAQEMGVTGVPFFVVDGKFAIAGAQPVDVMLSVLDRAWSKAHPTETTVGSVVTTGANCDDGSCDV